MSSIESVGCIRKPAAMTRLAGHSDMLIDSCPKVVKESIRARGVVAETRRELHQLNAKLRPQPGDFRGETLQLLIARRSGADAHDRKTS
jgi:hypothetical protein